MLEHKDQSVIKIIDVLKEQENSGKVQGFLRALEI
jgi:hypothetical protein